MRMVKYSFSKVTLNSARNGVPLTTRPRSAPVTMKNLRGQIAECKRAARKNNKTNIMDNILASQNSKHQGTAETAPHCILNKRITSDSSYIICSFPDFNCSSESLATFGLAQ